MNRVVAEPRLPECPAPVAALLQRLPPYPGSVMFVAGLNVLLAAQLPPDVAAMLQGRRLCLQVRDARLRFDFTWDGRRFAALPRQQDSELTISATAPDFVRLARRQDDPDTLFFSRRLGIEGDTELGLVVKNTLDALEWPVLDPTRWRAKPRGGPPGGPWS